MTRELKDLMDRATDRPTPHIPDVDHLLAAGNRSVRKRQLMGALATAVAVAVVAGGTTLALNNSTQSSPAPAASPPQEQYAVRTICEPAKAPPERPEVDNADRWPQVIVSDQDPDGTVSVRRSADGRDLAFCATLGYVSGANQYFGSLGAYRAGKLTAAETIHRFNAPGCGTPERINCNGTTYSFAGKLPSGVTRVTAELEGNRTEGVVRDGYYAYRLFRSRPNIDIKEVPIKMSMYNSAGRLVRELSIGPA
jgi:hypothetical protein